MFRGLPPRKPSPPAEVVAPDSEKKPKRPASTDGKRPSDGAVPFSASPYKKLPGSQPSWVKMDLSLMPKEIAEELGVDFTHIDPATTGSARELPEKLRPLLADLGGDPEAQGGGGGVLADQRSGLISQLLVANWDNAPDSLKHDIKKFLDGEISRSLAITDSITGGITSEETRVRPRGLDSKSAPSDEVSEQLSHPPGLETSEGEETLWGKDQDLDQLIS